MQLDENEEKLLRSVALQNARAVFRAREKAERQLVEANQRITNILESITDGFIVFDTDWKITYINSRGAELVRPLYASRQEFIGRNHWEVFPETVGTALEEHYRRAMREQVTVHFENFYPPLNAWFDIRAYPSPQGLTVYFQDITERKRAADALGEQREWLAVTLRSIGDGVIATDTEEKVTFLNPVAEMMTGWRNEEAIGQPLSKVFELINERTRQPTEPPIRKVLREQRVVGLANHTALVGRDGTEMAIEDSAAPIRDAKGKITGAVMVFHDVTERRRADLAMRESEERWRGVFNHAAVGIALASLEGRFSQVNKKFTEILGYSAEELLTKTAAEITHPEDRPQTRDHLTRLVRGEIPHYVMEKRYLRKDGEVVWSLTTVTVVKDEEGKPQRCIGVIEDITSRKNAEAERARLTSVLERSLNEIYIFDTETLRFDYVNEGARRNLGFTMDQMRQKTPLDIKPEFTAPQFREMVRPLLAGEKAKHLFYTIHRRADGTDYPVEVHLQAVAHAGRRVFLAVILDITERKKAEEKLRRSEEELRALANSIPQLAWMAEPDGHIFWYNRRWYEYTGTTFEQMQGWGWQSVHDPRMLPLVVERWKQSLGTGQPFDMEFPLRGADGVFRWFLTRVNPVRDSEGRITRWFGTNTDVDVVRRAQEALQDETRVLELLNDTGRAIASNLDLQSLVQTVTDSATKLTGAKFGAFFYNVTNEKGESFVLYTLSGAPREAFEKFGLPRNTPVFNPTFRGEGAVRSDDITKDPRYGTMAPHHGMPKGHLPVRSYLAVPVISRTGEVIGGLFFGHPEAGVFTERSERLVVGVAAQAAIAIDNARLYEAAQKEILERKRVAEELNKAQEELSHYAEDLEKQVALRTASLREAIGQMEEFSYTVSHDLRAPLRGMQAYADALLQDFADSLPAEAGHYLTRIATNANRLDKMILDVLTFSRIARAELGMEKVNLDKLVRQIVEQYPEMQVPGVRIEIKPLHEVLGHESSLTQAISNLLNNAVKFVAPGVKPHVSVWSEREAGRVRLWVADNGIGVNPKYQHRLFGMFERVHPDLKYDGTGVGLAIVRKAVERMGGRAGMESDGVSGSRFWIELRAVDEE